MISLKSITGNKTNCRAEELWSKLQNAEGLLKVEYDNSEKSEEIKKHLKTGINEVGGFIITLDCTQNFIVYVKPDITTNKVIDSQILPDESVVKA